MDSPFFIPIQKERRILRLDIVLC